jgi:hypothetical protein
MTANSRNPTGQILPLLFGLMLWGCAESSSDARLDAETTIESTSDDIDGFSQRLIQDLRSFGPSGWLRHFEDSENFYMGSDGRIVFPSADSARIFVEQLATKYSVIDLNLLDVRRDHHSAELVTIVSPYLESITDKQGDTISFGGLVSMVLVKRGADWKIRSLHWSSPVQNQ